MYRCICILCFKVTEVGKPPNRAGPYSHSRTLHVRLVTLSSSVSAHDGTVLGRSLNVFWAFTKQLNEVLFVLSADISVLKNAATLHIKFSVVGPPLGSRWVRRSESSPSRLSSCLKFAHVYKSNPNVNRRPRESLWIQLGERVNVTWERLVLRSFVTQVTDDK